MARGREGALVDGSAREARDQVEDTHASDYIEDIGAVYPCIHDIPPGASRVSRAHLAKPQAESRAGEG
jgi:hypothetical protein